MIWNDRQYRISNSEVLKFQEALEQIELGEGDRVLREIRARAIASQLESLQREIAEYEFLRSGKVRSFEARSLDELPLTLVRARIASGLSQRELADRVGLKEQQIQRYEADGYAGARITRLQEIADSLGLKVRSDVYFEDADMDKSIMARLKSAGVDVDLVNSKLVDKSRGAERSHGLVSSLERVFGFEPEALRDETALTLDPEPALAASFKMPSSAGEGKVLSHSIYGYYIATRVLEATPDMESRLPKVGWREFKKLVEDSFGEVTLKSVVETLWDYGVAVVPLSGTGGFHACYWRIDGRDVILLKQQTKTIDRWLFDLLHEVYHAIVNDSMNHLVVEVDDGDATDDEEVEANQFAGNVLLEGQAESLVKVIVQKARNKTERLKKATESTAQEAGVSVGALANYLAWRLSAENTNWWGTAQNLQDSTTDPSEIVRDALLLRADFQHLQNQDLRLIELALREE